MKVFNLGFEHYLTQSIVSDTGRFATGITFIIAIFQNKL